MVAGPCFFLEFVRGFGVGFFASGFFFFFLSFITPANENAACVCPALPSPARFGHDPMGVGVCKQQSLS